MNPSNLITTKQVKRKYGLLSASSLIFAVKRGDVKVAMRAGRRVFYDAASVEAAFKAGLIKRGTKHRKSHKKPATAPVEAYRAPVAAAPLDLETLCTDIVAGTLSVKEIAKAYDVTPGRVYGLARELRKRGVSVRACSVQIGYKTALDAIAAKLKAESAPRMSAIG